MVGGDISYSVYMWGFWVEGMLGAYFNSANASGLAYFNSSVKLIITLLLTTVFAYGSYWLIEDPSRRWIRNVLERRRTVTATSPAALGNPASGRADY